MNPCLPSVMFNLIYDYEVLLIPVGHTRKNGFFA